MASGILVPWSGIELAPLHWRCVVWTTGPPGKSLGVRYLTQWLTHNNCSINDAYLSRNRESTIPEGCTQYCRNIKMGHLAQLQWIHWRLPGEDDSSWWWNSRNEQGKRGEEFQTEEPAVPPTKCSASSGPLHCTVGKTTSKKFCWEWVWLSSWIFKTHGAQPVTPVRFSHNCLYTVNLAALCQIPFSENHKPAHVCLFLLILIKRDSWGSEEAGDCCPRECPPLPSSSFRNRK